MLKTKLAHNRFLLILALCLVVLAIGVFIHRGGPRLTIGADKHTYKIELARTSQEQQTGLGGRVSIDQNKAMLFVFENPQVVCMWMKDMKFPIDIVWMNSAKIIVATEKNVSPSTYPKSFCPKVPTSYVLEMHAGEIDRNKIQLNQKAQFRI